MELRDEIGKSLLVAMQRVGMDYTNLFDTINDIIQEFEHLKLSQILSAIRLGSLGKYGRSYRLSTQEVCYWIREYVKENNKTLSI